MTNPGNIVRVRSRNASHASVYEANAWCQPFSTGVLSGNGVIENTSPNMNVLVGGAPSTPDIIIASNASGYKIALDLVGQQAITITAPASNSRITSIVAYTDDLSLKSTDTGTTGSPSSCGLIVVNGTASGSPVAPTDSVIRSAITADGAAGSQAVYSVLANITVASSTTSITNSLITRRSSTIGASALADGSVTAPKVDFTTFPRFFAYAAGSQASISSSQILFANTKYNVGSGYSTATSRFTAPVAGTYHFSATIAWQSVSAQTVWGNFYVNGSNYTPSLRFSRLEGQTGNPYCSGSVDIYLNAGDYVTVIGTIVGTARSTESAISCFCGYLVALS